MARIVVLGAGVCGMAAGMLLRRDGHEVTVLERDPEPAPESVQDACPLHAQWLEGEPISDLRRWLGCSIATGGSWRMDSR